MNVLLVPDLHAKCPALQAGPAAFPIGQSAMRPFE